MSLTNCVEEIHLQLRPVRIFTQVQKSSKDLCLVPFTGQQWVAFLRPAYLQSTGTRVPRVLINGWILREDLLDQPVPGELLANDLPGELVEPGQLLDGGQVEARDQLLHQLRGRPEFPLCIVTSTKLLISGHRPLKTFSGQWKQSTGRLTGQLCSPRNWFAESVYSNT